MQVNVHQGPKRYSDHFAAVHTATVHMVSAAEPLQTEVLQLAPAVQNETNARQLQNAMQHSAAGQDKEHVLADKLQSVP